MNITKRTFTQEKDTLPSISFLKKYITTDDNFGFEWNIEKDVNTFRIREEYIKHSFPILSHELMLSIKKMVDDLNIKKITELSCGIGWLTYWLRKYGIPIIDSVDNMSWQAYQSRYMQHVKKEDSVEYVKQGKSIELFILSWPYMDTVALDIWQAMKKGQYLLFIGEDNGGCTASNDFFDKVENFQLDDK